jgi:hypothetical protein
MVFDQFGEVETSFQVLADLVYGFIPYFSYPRYENNILKIFLIM